MIRNAVIHLANEQPLLADLFAPPSGADTSLVCTNLRTMNGARPVFADHADSLFVFPYAHIRFVEVAASALAAAEPMLEAGDDGRGHGRRNGSGGKAAPGQRTDIGTAAIAAAMAETARAAAGAAAAVAASEPAVPSEGPAEDAEPAGPVDDLDQELEIDEDFLRRVREI